MALKIYSDIDFCGTKICYSSEDINKYIGFNPLYGIKIVDTKEIQLQYWDGTNNKPYKYIVLDSKGLQLQELDVNKRAKIYNGELEIEDKNTNKTSVLNSSSLIFNLTNSANEEKIFTIGVSNEGNLELYKGSDSSGAKTTIKGATIDAQNLHIKRLYSNATYGAIDLYNSLIPQTSEVAFGNVLQKISNIYCKDLYADNIIFNRRNINCSFSAWSGNDIREIIYNDQFNQSGYQLMQITKMSFKTQTVYYGFIALDSSYNNDQINKLYNGDEGWIHIKLPEWGDYSSNMKTAYSNSYYPMPDTSRSCIATPCRMKSYNQTGELMTWTADNDIYIGLSTSTSPIMGISFMLTIW